MTAPTRFAAVRTIIEAFLAQPDAEALRAAAADLGVLDGRDIALGQDDEAEALLDYYLFAASAENGRPRIHAFIAAPPTTLSPDGRALFAALAQTHFSIFERRPSTHPNQGGVLVRDIFSSDATYLLEEGIHLPMARDGDYAAMRLVQVGDRYVHTGAPMALTASLVKGLRSRKAIAAVANQRIKAPTAAASLEDASHAIDDRALLKAIFAARAAAAPAKTRLKKPKRSLKR